MKKFLLFGAIALSTLTFGQNVPSYVPTNGLVGWWPFNGNANDESGNGNNGTVNGATLTSDRFGNANNAYFYDGLNDYIDYGNESILNPTNQITISAWIYPNSLNSNGGFLIQRLTSQGGSSYGIVIKTTEIGMNLNNSSTGPADANTMILYAPATLFENQWYHVVGAYNGSELKIYLDGQLIGTIVGNYTLDQNTWTNISGLDIDQSGFNQQFTGKIDDLGIWNIGLTSQEVTDLYNATTCQTPTATITPQGNTTFCQGNSVVLEATSGSNYTYQWYKNGNAINGETNQTYTATTSGNYTVKVIDDVCEETSSTTTVTVNSNPTVSFTLSSMISNDNGNVTLNGSPSGGTYSGNGITGNTLDPSSVTLGKHTIVYNYTDNNGCSGSKTATTVIYDTTGTVCSAYDTTFVTIDVYDTTFVTQTIYDTITIENHISVTDTLIIDISLAGLSAPNNINTMKVYPNPSNDVVNIDNGDYALMNGYSIKIINALGQEKFNNAINIPAFQIPVSQLGATGIYYINIYDNQSQLVESKVLVLE